ncbi:MAG: adenylate kinase family protein [Candidatus Aenigmarchaeota archaeon]|nr:adenylate kinase family protein [Candidatus Aenigmarchaeota archaeon]
MIIAISGTPGTGKTAVGRMVAKKLVAELVDVNILIKQRKMHFRLDKKRNTKIIDPKELDNAVQRMNGNIVVDSHISHLIKSDVLFVLRCRPDVLKKRLDNRGWNKKKVLENAQAEILDEVMIEALQCKKAKRVFEIDTTKMGAKKIAGMILRILKYFSSKRYAIGRYTPGRIDWSEKFKNMLTKG